MAERPADSPDAVSWSPNPGSNAALAAGCICPVMDNNHGQWPPHPPDGWWITAGCPVHFPHPAQRTGTDG